jgi:hypothetical protein
VLHLQFMTIPLHQTSPQSYPQQGNMTKKTAMRDRLPAQVFTRGTSGAVTVKTHSTDSTTAGSSEDFSRSSHSQTRDPTRDRPRERSPRPPRTRRRSSSARRKQDDRTQGRSVRSGDYDYRHQVPHLDSSSDQGSAASPGSHSRGSHTSNYMSSRDSASIQKPPPQKPGSRDSSPAPSKTSLDSQKMHIKATKKVIDGTFQSRSRINPIISVDGCSR